MGRVRYFRGTVWMDWIDDFRRGRNCAILDQGLLGVGGPPNNFEISKIPFILRQMIELFYLTVNVTFDCFSLSPDGRFLKGHTEM